MNVGGTVTTDTASTDWIGGGVGAASLVGEEGRSLGEHVLLWAGIRRRASIESSGGLDGTGGTQWGDRTPVDVQLERRGTGGGGRRDGGDAGAVAVGWCDRRAGVLAADATLNRQLQHQHTTQGPSLLGRIACIACPIATDA